MAKYKVLGTEGETVELVAPVAVVEAVAASEGVEAVEAVAAVEGLASAVGSEVELEESVAAPLVEAGKLEAVQG